MIDGATAVFSDDWLLKPILGQAVNSEIEVVFLFKIKVRSVIYCVVDSLQHPQLVNIVEPPEPLCEWSEVPPSLVRIKLPDYGHYSVTWLLAEEDAEINKIIGYQSLLANRDIGNLFAFSCDMPAADGAHSLWDDMLVRMTKQTACLHLGDQIYGDAVYRRNIMLPTPDAGKVYADYSKLYQEMWSPRAELLSQTWNYFTADDHEITNDMRLYQDLTDKETVVAKAAWKAYLDYQLALTPDRSQFYSEFSYMTWLGAPGSIRLFMIERTSEPLDVRRLIEAMLEVQDDFNYLILALPCAPVIKPSGLGSSFIRDDRYLEPSLAIELYDYLLSLVKPDRYIILLGGDCHYGSHRVVSRGSRNITVLTCSPLTNQPDLGRAFAASMTKSRELLPADDRPSLQEEIISCHARKNYAELDFMNDKVIMHYGDGRPKSMVRYIKNLWTMRKPAI